MIQSLLFFLHRTQLYNLLKSQIKRETLSHFTHLHVSLYTDNYMYSYLFELNQRQPVNWREDELYSFEHNNFLTDLFMHVHLSVKIILLIYLNDIYYCVDKLYYNIMCTLITFVFVKVNIYKHILALCISNYKRLEIHLIFINLTMTLKKSH